MPRLVFLLFTLSFGLSAQSVGQYQVKLDAKSGLVNVDACLAQPTRYLTTGRRSSHQYLNYFSQLQTALPISSRITLADKTNHCFQYQVALRKAMGSRQSHYQEQSWLADNQSWLWLPIENVQLTISFDQPVSVPWPEFKKRQYIIDTENAFWSSRMAFGQLQQYQLKVGDQPLRLDLVGQFSSEKQQHIIQWLEYAASSVSSIYQSFPVSNVQLLVTKAKRGSGPVPWGEVQRGGYPAVHLFINPSHSLERFKSDWTASHELSHLLLPRIRGRDRWLSEGIASYYQNMARAKAGQLGPEQAWQKLAAGFNRGHKAAASTPLRQAYKTMHIYWGGAAIFMLADMRLRQQTPSLSLDQVLHDFQRCCLPNKRLWSAEQLMQKLDQLSNSNVFSQLLAQEVQANTFPVSKAFIKGPAPTVLFSHMPEANPVDITP